MHERTNLFVYRCVMQPDAVVLKRLVLMLGLCTSANKRKPLRGSSTRGSLPDQVGMSI
jgi:hypothetical protein